MQSLPSDPYISKVYKYADNLNLPNVSVVQMGLAQHLLGSCCDGGHYVVAKCKGWWYNCRLWGLKDINPWFQFGEVGFTTPSATEHTGRCTYSEKQIHCPVISNCEHRSPPLISQGSRHTLGGDICEGMPTKVKLGPLQNLQQL